MSRICGSLQIYEGVLNGVGETCLIHKHPIAHTTYIYRGAALVEELELVREFPNKRMTTLPDGTSVEEEFTDREFRVVRSTEKHAGRGRNWALIKAHTFHRFTALVPGTEYHCIFSHYEPDGTPSQEFTGFEAATNEFVV